MKVTYTNQKGEEQTFIFDNPNEVHSIIEKIKIENLDNLKIERDTAKDLVLKYPLSRKQELDNDSNLQFIDYSRIDKDPLYKVVGRVYPYGYIGEIKSLEKIFKNLTN
jgi:hypothetical protein